jgi:hypothetical protein
MFPNTYIHESRHDARVATEGEREEMEAWRVTELRQEASKREENRAAWPAYFERIAGSLRARAEEYDQRAQTLIAEVAQTDQSAPTTRGGG